MRAFVVLGFVFPYQAKRLAWGTSPAWRSGNVVGHINKVAQRRARLVLGWVTIFDGQTTSVFHQATQANSASYPQRDRK